MITNDATVPPVVKATILEGVARTPVKRQLNIRAQMGGFQYDNIGAPDIDPDEAVAWLEDAQRQMRTIRIYSQRPKWNNKAIFIDSVIPIYQSFDEDSKTWDGEIAIVVREA